MRTPFTGLYGIIDPRFCRQPPLALAEALLAGGCRLLQLRVKQEDPKRAAIERQTLAFGFSRLRRAYDFGFILNDDVVLARELKADGVHLGATDPSVAEARTILGPQALIGYSAHSLTEAVAAEAAGADYVAFGAIYPTTTKGSGHPVQGLAHLTEVVHTLSVPVVAIGGIGRQNVREVWQTGVAAAAMITALAFAPDPCAEASWFVAQLRKDYGRKQEA